MCYNNSSTSFFYGLCTFTCILIDMAVFAHCLFLSVVLLLMQVEADKQHFILYFKYVY